MNKIPRETLAECLDLLEQGFSVEQVVARFPEDGEALRPFLDTAVQLSRLASAPTVAAERQSRQAVLRAVSAAHDERGAGAPIWLALRRVLAPAVSLAIVLLLFGVALPLISAPALPGDGLYGAKRLVERTQLILEPSTEGREELHERFNEERIREVQALLQTGREAPVQFEGPVEEIGPESWVVAGVRVFFDENTFVEGEPWPGGLARVEGETRNGRLTATRLTVLEDPPPTPQPQVTPEATPSPTATSTATPTATATATPTSTATATATPTASATATGTPEALPTPAPISATSTPAPSATSDDGDVGNENDDNGNDNGDDDENGNDDNENDNGDDNGNDNGDDENENGGDDGNDNGGDDSENENDDDEGSGGDSDDDDEEDS